MELKHIEKLNIMKLMVSFRGAVKERMKFEPLSFIDMKKAYRTLPEIGHFQAKRNEEENQSKGKH